MSTNRNFSLSRTTLVLGIVVGAFAIVAYFLSNRHTAPDVTQLDAGASAPGARTAVNLRKDKDECTFTTPGPVIDASYRTLAKQGAGLTEPDESHDTLLRLVRARNLHYLYVGFLERFPESSARKELECLARAFAALRPDSPVLLTLGELSEKYHYDGVMTMAHWTSASGPIAMVRGIGITGSPMIGNLQFIESPNGGGVRVTCEGMRIPAGATLIYPLSKAEKVIFPVGAQTLYQTCIAQSQSVAPTSGPPREARSPPQPPQPPQPTRRLEEGELCFGKQNCAKGLICENDLCVRPGSTR